MSQHKGSNRVQAYLEANGIDAKIVTFDESTKNSQLAAEALGCSVAEIAKSVVFKAGGIAIVVVISGDKRVNLGKLKDVLGLKVENANADAVRDLTGYVIGGIPPFPHDPSVRVLLDKSLSRFENVWAASGTPNSVMQIKVRLLKSLIDDSYIDVSQ